MREALTVVWEASDRICGKRLKAALPSMVESLEKHGHLDLDPGERRRMFSASAATIDRLLRPIREQAGSRRKRKQKRKMAGRIPVRTFSDWKEPEPGYLEIGLVAHCGGTVTGSYISSLVVTDVCSGWTEAIPLLAREQSLVVTGLEAVSRVFPVPIRGINSDNDSVFINETLLSYCEDRGIEFTRSRAYRKNDQAWIEQKNGSVVRRFVGHERYSGPMAGQTMAHLYGAMRLYVNHFQPSFQLLERTRDGGSVKKRYSTPATPCDRLLWRDDVSEELKAVLRDSRAELDPVSLLHTIREAQSALATINATDSANVAQSASLEHFLSSLPELWRQGEVRPTHVPKRSKRRGQRTRPDPFEGVWCEILDWLQQHQEVIVRKSAHCCISVRRCSSRSDRIYACSTDEPTVWARESSIAAWEADVHSAAHTRKEERKPCTVARSCSPTRFSTSVSVFSLRGAPGRSGDGKTHPDPSSMLLARSSTSIVALLRGTLCGRCIFIREVGIVHRCAVRSISDHSE